MSSVASERVSPEVRQFIASLPKVELHVHLEGAIDSATIWEMAQRNGISLPASGPDDLRRFFEYRDFDHFVEAYYAATSTMRTLDDWHLMIDRFMAGQAAQNIVYSEVFISASHHLGRHDTREWIETLRQAIQRGQDRHGVEMVLIPDISRETPESRFPVLDFVSEAAEQGVAIGLGLGGPEPGFPPEMFVDVYEEARARGLRLVAHAGETCGPESVRGAWKSLGAERLGHGFRVLEDAALTQEMAEQRVPFELNPSSNYCIGVVDRLQPHPIRRMLESGLMVTVNSDDPALFNTTLTGEYELLASQGFSPTELKLLAQNAIEASFAPDSKKKALREALGSIALP